MIGGGSIGQRHARILAAGLSTAEGAALIFSSVDLVSRHFTGDYEYGERFADLETAMRSVVASALAYDYVVIASETAAHSEQLSALLQAENHRVLKAGAKVLIEKPIFSQPVASPLIQDLSEAVHAQSESPEACTVLVAYNLRFHPIIQALYGLLANAADKPIYANVLVGQYLPDWRPGRDYRASYSADPTRGGGVLLDLSHEIDYLQLLFGELHQLRSFVGQISDLEILSEDLAMCVGRTQKGTAIQLSLDYLSRHPVRRILVHTKRSTFEADLIANRLRRSDQDGSMEIDVAAFLREGRVQATDEPLQLDRDASYQAMHVAALSGTQAGEMPVCSFREGMGVLRAIESIHEAAMVVA